MSDQKNWDAAMIRTWRTNSSLIGAMALFTALSGKRGTDCDPPLKRFPKLGMPWQIGVKVFVASFLPKINTWLWDHGADRDIDLLRKLEGSNYDCLGRKAEDVELNNERRLTGLNRKRMAVTSVAVAGRNHNTDWNVVKGGPVKRKK